MPELLAWLILLAITWMAQLFRTSSEGPACLHRPTQVFWVTRADLLSGWHWVEACRKSAVVSKLQVRKLNANVSPYWVWSYVLCVLCEERMTKCSASSHQIWGPLRLRPERRSNAQWNRTHHCSFSTLFSLCKMYSAIIALDREFILNVIIFMWKTLCICKLTVFKLYTHKTLSWGFSDWPDFILSWMRTENSC